MTYDINMKNNETSHIHFALDNNIINDRGKQNRNNSRNKKGRIKYRIKKWGN